MEKELWEWGCRHIYKVSARMRVRGWEGKPGEGSGTWGCFWGPREQELTKQAGDLSQDSTGNHQDGGWVASLTSVSGQATLPLVILMCQLVFGSHKYRMPTPNTSLQQVSQQVCMHLQPFSPVPAPAGIAAGLEVFQLHARHGLPSPCPGEGTRLPVPPPGQTTSRL